MKYRLRWKRAALNDLAKLWVSSTSEKRREVTGAVSELERQLTSDPTNAGESRSGDKRIVFHAPLAMVFEVDEGEAIVQVLATWSFD